MTERFAFNLLEDFGNIDCGNFAFTNGYCSKLPDKFVESAKNFYIEMLGASDNLEYIIRAAMPDDELYMRPILLDYGESVTNYGNLEFFPRDKLGIIAKNMTHWASHGRFFTILIFRKNNLIPIGFLQTDPYNIQSVESNIENFFLNSINRFLKKKITLHMVKSSAIYEIDDFFCENIIKEDLCNFLSTTASLGDIDATVLRKWINFSLSTFKTYKRFSKLANGENDVFFNNMSYSLFEKNKRQGIMLTTITNMIKFLQEAKIFKAIFTDRIATQNSPSIRLIDGLSFDKTSVFNVFYTDQYFTRNNPSGLFMEECASYIKLFSC